MLDLKWIRENPLALDKGLARRNFSLKPEDVPGPYRERKTVSAIILALDEDRRANTKALQDCQARRNAASKEIGKAKGKGGDPAKAEALMAEVAELKVKIAEGEARERELDAQMQALLAGIPNLLLPDVPDGPDESANVELRKWGKPRNFKKEGFEPKQHFEIGEALGLMDFEAAAKISGARFTVLKGGLAKLERALGQFMLDVQTSEHGYTEVSPPLLVEDRAVFGTAQLPKFGDDLFAVYAGPAGNRGFLRTIQLGFLSQVDAARSAEDEKELGRLLSLDDDSVIANAFWLIPTSEVPLTNLVRESILAEADLPYRFTALTPCFRAEAGAAGKDTRGMIRQHQFYKVEMVAITAADGSEAEHQRMTKCAEEILKRLELPYRVVVLCSGDTGFASRKTHDIEVWLPGQNAYREISSCSNCGDFQARRMQARYRPAEGKDIQFVHTLNGSGLAVGRTLIAVMENYQEKDGSIRIPEVLRRYMGGLETIAGRSG
ncbi:MAG: serine--tRNA ligase [Rhodomicrobium sp.]